MTTRKRIIVTVETDLTDKQIEANGVTVYMPEPDGECHIALEVEVVRLIRADPSFEDLGAEHDNATWQRVVKQEQTRRAKAAR